MTGADFIWLTDCDGDRVLVNRSRILLMKQHHAVTTLHYGSRWAVNVKETPEEIASAERVSVGLDFVREMRPGEASEQADRLARRMAASTEYLRSTLDWYEQQKKKEQGLS